MIADNLPLHCSVLHNGCLSLKGCITNIGPLFPPVSSTSDLKNQWGLYQMKYFSVIKAKTCTYV